MKKKADAIYSMPPAAGLVERIRKLCSQLADSTETVTFGHPTFQTGGKTFAVFERYKGEFGLAVKVEKELQGVFVKDPRFYSTPYIGKHGWVTLRMDGAPIHWTEVRDLIRGSYRLISESKPKKKA